MCDHQALRTVISERLARYFGGDAHSWLNLEAIYDLRLAEIANARKIESEIMPIAV